MKCPLCIESQLVMADRSGIEIDYCPQCRGVWLDRGELDKIIERSSAAPTSPVAAEMPRAMPPQNPAPFGAVPHHYDRAPQGESYGRDGDDDDRHRDKYQGRDDNHRYDNDYRKKKKRGGFLEDLFDFD